MRIETEYKGKKIEINIPDTQEWFNIMDNDIEDIWNDTDEIVKELYNNYKTTKKEVEKELYTFWGKFAKDAIVTYSFKKVIDILKNIKPHIDKIYDKQQSILEKHLDKSYKNNFYKKSYNLQNNTKVFKDINKVEDRSVKVAMNYPWSGENFSDRIYNNKTKLINTLKQELTASMIRGDSIQTTSKTIAKRLDISYKNAERLVRTETAHIMTESDKQCYLEYGLEEYEYVATLDKRTSSICRGLDNRVFKVKDMTAGVNAPPMHPNCFHKEVEIFTNNGWKYFYDLDENDECLSFNPNNQNENRFIKPLKIISYEFNGKLINFKNKTLNISVTPNHSMLIKYKHTDSANKWRFLSADKVPKWNNVMYRSMAWHNLSNKFIEFAGFKIETHLFCKFLAYYLADGSYTYDKNKKNHRCKITQTDKLEYIYNELKELPFNVTKGKKENIYFYDQNICKELSKFGKCNEKYIPNFIKELGIEYLKTFLNAYSITDGNIKEGKVWKGSKFNDSITFFTTSKKMSDDLSELILKVGGRPSFKLDKVSGKSCFNGKYKHNFDMWSIYWNSKQYTYTQNIERNLIEYNDYVYCVELPYWNTILVRQNGKILWTGNCRSTTVPYYFNNLGKRIAKDINTNKYEYVPSNISYKTWYNKYVK